MKSHSVTCHPTEVILTPLLRRILRIAGTHVSTSEGWNAELTKVTDWLYQDGLPAHRWSPIQILTWPDVD